MQTTANDARLSAARTRFCRDVAMRTLGLCAIIDRVALESRPDAEGQVSELCNWAIFSGVSRHMSWDERSLLIATHGRLPPEAHAYAARKDGVHALLWVLDAVPGPPDAAAPSYDDLRRGLPLGRDVEPWLLDVSRAKPKDRRSILAAFDLLCRSEKPGQAAARERIYALRWAAEAFASHFPAPADEIPDDGREPQLEPAC